MLGTENPADLFTKHMDSAAKLEALVTLHGCEFRGGRPDIAPELKKQKNRVQDESRACLVRKSPRGGGPAAHNVEVACESLRGSSHHQVTILPHLRPSREIEQLYPEAVLDQEYDEEEECALRDSCLRDPGEVSPPSTVNAQIGSENEPESASSSRGGVRAQTACQADGRKRPAGKLPTAGRQQRSAPPGEIKSEGRVCSTHVYLTRAGLPFDVCFTRPSAI